MKRFTRNFIIIMASGLFIIFVLANDFFASGSPMYVFSGNGSKEINTDDVCVSVDRLSPDEIDIERAFSSDRMGSTSKTSADTANSTALGTVEDNFTTVTTQLPSATTMSNNLTEPAISSNKITTTATVTKKANDVSNIKNPNYNSPYYIVVYTGSQSVVVYGKDSSGAYSRIVKSFTCSTGSKSSTPTRQGVYTIRAKYRWRELMGGVYGQYSSSISSSYLFHSVPYAAKDPSTLYDASYNNLGKDVSHGCIRLCVRDCKWIYDNAPIGTQVNVVWTSGPAGAGVPQRKSGSKYSGWDPSDQWAAGNPYFAQSETTTTTTAAKKTTITTTTTTTITTTATTAAATSATTPPTLSTESETIQTMAVPEECSDTQKS